MADVSVREARFISQSINNATTGDQTSLGKDLQLMDFMALQMQIYAFLHHRSRHKHIREKWRVKSAYKPLTVVRLTAGVPCRTVQAAEFAPGVKAIIKRLTNNLLTQRLKCLDGCREITQYQRILEFRRHPFNKLQVALLCIAALGYTVKFSNACE